MDNRSLEYEFDLGVDAKYKDVLTEIGEEVPAIFKQQAEKASRLFTMLDNGVDTTDTNELLETISRASFVGTFRARKPEKFKTSFPQWIIEAREINKMVNFPIAEDAISAYKKWVFDNKGLERIDPNGTYVDYPKSSIGGEEVSSIRSFKAYVSNDVTAEKLINTLEILKKKGVHPDVTKLSTTPNRLVFYWTTSPTDELLSTLDELGIRDMGQDSIRITNDSGEIKARVSVSRDRSLGMGQSVVDFGQEKFDKAKFFKNYLNQCLFWWRNPSDPRWMSYIPSEVKSENIPKEIIKDADEIRMEIVYNPSRRLS